MERLLAWLFASIILITVVALDFYSARQTNHGLDFSEHVSNRLRPVLGSEALRSLQVASADAPQSDISPTRAVGLAIGALTGISVTLPQDGLAMAIPSAAVAAPQEGELGQVVMTESVSEMAQQQGITAPEQGTRPGVFHAKGGTLTSSCATKAGTKFCSVGGQTQD